MNTLTPEIAHNAVAAVVEMQRAVIEDSKRTIQYLNTYAETLRTKLAAAENAHTMDAKRVIIEAVERIENLSTSIYREVDPAVAGTALRALARALRQHYLEERTGDTDVPATHAEQQHA